MVVYEFIGFIIIFVFIFDSGCSFEAASPPCLAQRYLPSFLRVCNFAQNSGSSFLGAQRQWQGFPAFWTAVGACLVLSSWGSGGSSGGAFKSATAFEGVSLTALCDCSIGTWLAGSRFFFAATRMQPSSKLWILGLQQNGSTKQQFQR